MTSDLLQDQWLAMVAALIVGLPVALVVLTEAGKWLERAGNQAAKPILFLRNWVVPLAAVVAIVMLSGYYPQEHNWVRVLVTALGFLVIVFVLSALNVVIFRNARANTWQAKIPSIFVDLVRLLMIVLCVAALFSFVWGADIGGLFAALGVGSIVIGLALQNAVGGLVSGLLLLFEQPFRKGDWIDTGSVTGVVKEVNWRAVHIDVFTGTQIIPNSVLATTSFKNISRRKVPYRMVVTTVFAPSDPPDKVVSLLRRVADQLPLVDRRAEPDFEYRGYGVYDVGLKVSGPSDRLATSSQFLTWLWYAAKREGLSFDAEPPLPPGGETVEGAVAKIVPVLDLNAAARALVERNASIEVYGPGEVVQAAGHIPESMRFVVKGSIVDTLALADGAKAEVAQIGVGDFVGMTAFTREPTALTSTAVEATTVLRITVTTLHDVSGVDPGVARTLGRSVQHKQQLVSEALQAARGQVARTR
ncbi:MAG: mechanosensitive ion channel [Propionibacteriaceae bacterium]|jgi:small-conductance mechanosensitive channel|nr:mechanosensitive ion channel [Propionibacteriaceae bacterium]